MKNKTVRLLAVELLTRVESQGTYSNLALNKVIEENNLSVKDTKLLTLVPISFAHSVENKELEPQSIGNLPIVFETSEYGKVVIEDIKITDTEIKYTYYKDGVVPGYLTLWFYDEEGDEIDISSSVKESLDRHTGRYTTILKLEGYENDISKIRKIKKVSTFSHSDMKLLYDQQIKIDLKE